MIIINGVPHFGSPQTGIEYIQRPSVYALIWDADQHIAVVKHRGAFFLPGGGIEPGETLLEALQRELLEETGYRATKATKCCQAVEYLQGISNSIYYCIHSTFFSVRLQTKISTSTEADHQLIWLKLESAIPRMQRACHRWAITSLKPGDRTNSTN